MKALADLTKVLFFIISLIAIVAATRVASASETEPLFDAVKWQQHQKALSTKEAMALVKLVSIQYDENINRPWGADFDEEKAKRWKVFREFFCPSKIDLCLLSEEAKLSSISNVLKQESTLKQINEHLKKLGSPVSIVRLKTVPALLPEDMSVLNDFNFIIGVVQDEKNADGRTFQRIKDILLMDVGSYFLGFQKQPPAIYFAIDIKNQMLVLDETIIAKALEFAPIWQKSVMNEVPEGFLYVPNRLVKDYFDSKKENSVKYQGLKNLEGVEWLVYDELNAIAVNQALYMQLSWREELDGLSKEMIVRRGLLQLQKDFDMRWISLLFLNQSFDQNAPVIQQYTPVTTVNTVIRENVNALLAVQGFPALPYKKDWMQNTDLKYLQDEKFLKEFNLDLYEALDQINFLNKDWSNLTAGQKRSIAIATVYPKNLGYADEVKDIDSLIRTRTTDTKHLNKAGMYRIFSTLAASKDLFLMSKLADEIYDRRFTGL